MHRHVGVFKSFGTTQREFDYNASDFQAGVAIVPERYSFSFSYSGNSVKRCWWKSRKRSWTAVDCLQQFNGTSGCSGTCCCRNYLKQLFSFCAPNYHQSFVRKVVYIYLLWNLWLLSFGFLDKSSIGSRKVKTQVITVTSQMSLRSGINIIVSQRERAVNTGKLPEARETAN